jgi:hypothetical protein
MLKKVLATFVLMMAIPLASQAMTLTNAFLTSSTGSAVIGVNDTIQFEVTITLDTGFHIQAGSFTLAGDIGAALGSTLGSGWAGVSNLTTGWDWNYKDGGSGLVKFPTNSTITPLPAGNPAGPSRIVANSYGFFGTNLTANNQVRVIGTVTVTATNTGSFLGGAYMVPLGDFFGGTDGNLNAPIAGASFTVVPEPGTALLMLLGLGGLGLMGRKGRS